MTPETLKHLEDQLWKSADDLRANSDLTSNEYGTPVLGLIFLKFADGKFSQHEAAIQAEHKKLQGGRRERSIEDIAIEHCGFYLPPEARYGYLLGLPEDADIAQKLKDAMAAIEQYAPELEGVLPTDEYFALTRNQQSGLINRLLNNFANIPDDAEGDLFGKIYEYFLGKFALAEGQGGGEFFTPTSVVRLMVEIIEPHGGSVFDPACGSGGMFVQSAQFIEEHRKALKQANGTSNKNGGKGSEEQGDLDLFVCGQEKTLATVKLARMNLAVNGLRGEIHQAISYRENPANSLGRFDYVLANPPFNVDDVSYNDVKDDPRFNAYGIPRRKTKKKSEKASEETVPNANYLWINLFATSLKKKGRAALVMANSASDARHSEADIRRELIEQNLIYGMLTLPSNMFYTVTLPATLWFFDKGKTVRLNEEHAERILFIDARNVFTQIDRAHREFSEAQIQNLATINRLYSGKREAMTELVDRYFADGMAQLAANAEAAPKVIEQVVRLINDDDCQQAAGALSEQWQAWPPLQTAYADYQNSDHGEDASTHNNAQRVLAEPFSAFFTALHQQQKTLDKALRHWERALVEVAGKKQRPDKDVKALKQAMDTLHSEMRDAEQSFQHIDWLQSRFPEARYEDVVGLCKAASKAEIEDQDWSLNPGRYVGVVIEEDGRTEEEFISELSQFSDSLQVLDASANELKSIVLSNVEKLVNV